MSDYDRSQNRIKIFESGDCVLHEIRVYATREFGTDGTIVNSSVQIRSESDH